MRYGIVGMVEGRITENQTIKVKNGKSLRPASVLGGGKEISVAVLFNRGKRRSRRLVTGVVE